MNAVVGAGGGVKVEVGPLFIIMLPLIRLTGTSLLLWSLIFTLEREISDEPDEPIAVVLIMTNLPGVDTPLGPRIASKIFTTLPSELFMAPPLKNVFEPVCFKNSPS